MFDVEVPVRFVAFVALSALAADCALALASVRTSSQAVFDPLRILSLPDAVSAQN
jgi:hypothetical protein